MASVKNCRGSRRRSPKHKRVEQAAYIGMDPGGNVRRLPTTHAMRMRKRDNKMWRRETERAGGLRDIKSKCPCRLCLFGRPLLRTTQARHLRDYGRHPSRSCKNRYCTSTGMYVRTRAWVRYGLHVVCTWWRDWVHAKQVGAWGCPNPMCITLGLVAQPTAHMLAATHGFHWPTPYCRPCLGVA